jgi:hypothetical protein
MKERVILKQSPILNEQNLLFQKNYETSSKQKIEEMIKEIWMNLYLESPVKERNKNNIKTYLSQMAILVQEHICPDYQFTIWNYQ